MSADLKPAPLPESVKTFPHLLRDDAHIYWLYEGLNRQTQRLEGVTEVMADNRLEDATYFTEEHSTRGIAVHAELANIANGLAEFPFLDPDLYGWVQSGKLFLADLARDGATILLVEAMRWHPLYRYAGTVDLVVLWRGYEWVLDWKTGKASKVTRFKLGAYDMLLGAAANGKQRKRASIELDRDGGNAKLVEYNKHENFHDGNAFLAFLTTSRMRKLCCPSKD